LKKRGEQCAGHRARQGAGISKAACTCGAWAIHVSSAGGFEVQQEGLGQGRKRPIVRQRGHGKKLDQVRSMHSLETAESYRSGHGKMRPGKGHSPTGNCRGRDEPGHRKKAIR